MKRRKRRRKKKDKVKKVRSCTLSKARALAGTELITKMHVNQKITNISDHNS